MKGAIATIVWGFCLSFICYGAVSLLAHCTKLFPPLPLYATTVIGFSIAIIDESKDKG